MTSVGVKATKEPQAMDRPEIVRAIAPLRNAVRKWRGRGLTIALVPTMGAIHDGHISLVRLAQNRCDRVIVSLFVNPKQFGATEDISSYPANEAHDASLLADAGVDLLFAPPGGEIFPEGFTTTVTVSDITKGLCGHYRPGHFAGVATIVTKLLLQAAPDVAVFGEKDFQQLLVVRRLVHDLDIPVETVAAPTVRDPDGLAVSSRNAYLTPAERVIAPALYDRLSSVADQVAGGADCAAECARATAELLAAGFATVDYIAVCDASTLQPVNRVSGPSRVLGAAWLGKSRLIDNLAVTE